MPKIRRRTAVLTLSGLVALAVAVGLVAWLLIDTDRIRERLKASLDETLGMDVRMGEPPRFGLLRGANVTLENLELSSGGQVVATVENVDVRLALFSLLSGEVEPIEVHIERPEIIADPVWSGMFQGDDREQEGAELNDMSLARLRVSGARLRHADQEAESEWLFEGCDIDLRDIRHGGGLPERALGTLAAEGAMDCGTVSRGRFAVKDLSIRIDGEKGMFTLDPITATAFEGDVAGRLDVDLSSGEPGFRLEGGLSGMDLGAFVAALEPDQSAAGEVDFDLALNAEGSTWQALQKSTAGKFSLGGDELTIDGYDLDEELENYAETQRFNLIDVGAVFLAGRSGRFAGLRVYRVASGQRGDHDHRPDGIRMERRIRCGAGRRRGLPNRGESSGPGRRTRLR